MGVSIASVSRWENGLQTVSLDDLESIAERVEKPLQYFLPDRWIDEDAVSPELSLLVNRIEEYPERRQREIVTTLLGFMDLIEAR